jgi:hypothetical protein
MTPTASRLKARLDERRRWFQNEWFYKWHFIGKDGPVSIDSFDGRGIHFGGIAFSGSARDVYWDAIARGVRKEITEQFAWVDQEVRGYKQETALKAIDECAGQLVSFVRVIRRIAVDKDRILRGDGRKFPSNDDAGWWEGTTDGEIGSQAEALKASLPLFTGSTEQATLPVENTRRRRATTIWNENQWWLGPTGWVFGLIGLVALLF